MIVTLPGGVPLQYNTVNSIGDAKRLIDSLQSALAAYKPILTLFDIIGQIKKVLDAAPDIPTDPTQFNIELTKLVKMISKVARFLPQYSVPIMVRDSLNALISLIIGIEQYLKLIVKLAERTQIINDNLYKDEKLKDIAIDLANLQAKYTDQFTEYISSFIGLYNVIKILGDMIGLNLPNIDLSNITDVSELNNTLKILGNIKQALQLIVRSLGG